MKQRLAAGLPRMVSARMIDPILVPADRHAATVAISRCVDGSQAPRSPWVMAWAISHRMRGMIGTSSRYSSCAMR